MNALFYAHSGLRYLVLLTALVAIAYLGYALATRKPAAEPGRKLLAVFTGLLDLQIVLGLILMVAGLYYPALLGHLFMMLLAAAAAHAASVMSRRGTDERRALQFRLIGVGLALLLILGGISAIGRSVFGSGTPTVTP